jgi:lysophospholipase L1-like esterase
MQHAQLLRRAAAGSAVAATILLLALPALAQQTTAQQTAAPQATPAALGPAIAAAPASKCVVTSDIARFDIPLPRMALRVTGGLPVKIVAIGSSSTYGAGASTPTGSYPSRLEAELKLHFPGHELTVINRGVNGEEAADMLARFEAGVIAENPHLVIWQVGTNSLLRDRPLDPRGAILHDGLARLKATRTDVVLMDPQYAPRVLAKADREAVVDQIAQIAKEEKVGLLRRYAMMRSWYETEKLPFDAFVTGDGLHMNDWGYSCLAKSLGSAIAEAVNRPTETASVPRPTR